MNSQIRIKEIVNIFDYEIVLKDPINYWYDSPAEYSISYAKYNSKNSKMIFKL